MDESTSREKVLKKIRAALLDKDESLSFDMDSESPVLKIFDDDPEMIFADEFTRINGQFLYCMNDQELRKNIISLVKTKKMDGIFTNEPSVREIFNESGIPCMLKPSDIRNLNTSITHCEYLIARFGAVMVSSAQIGGRRAFSYPENHIVIAYRNQLVNELEDALDALRNKYETGLPSQISLISGPSRTADIEKTLVLGAHGPKNLYVLFVDET